MTETIKCPNGHGEMALVKAKQEITFKGETINFMVDTNECNDCGLQVGTIEQTAAAQNTIADAYRKKVGLLTGKEIQEERAALGWSQKELAKKAGVGIASIKRWENGIIQTKPMNQALRSALQGYSIGNVYTGNRAKISLPRVKLVLKAFTEELGFGFLEEGDLLLFDAKYLWYADMIAYKLLGRGITGANYAALPHGPQLNNYKELVDLIHDANELDAEPLTEEEERIIRRVARTFPAKINAFDAAHREIAWIKRSMGELIPYSDADELTEI